MTRKEKIVTCVVSSASALAAIAAFLFLPAAIIYILIVGVIYAILVKPLLDRRKDVQGRQ